MSSFFFDPNLFILLFQISRLREVYIMAGDLLLYVVLAIIIGTLFAILFSLRVLVLMERRVARIEDHIESLVTKVLSEESKIEKLVSRSKRR